MKVLTLQARIAADRYLHLHVPYNLPPGDAEVVVIVQPLATSRPSPPFPSDEGVWTGKVPDFDIETELKEMSMFWEIGMELPQ